MINSFQNILIDAIQLIIGPHLKTVFTGSHAADVG